jgi:FkbM family methyltransferase
VIFRRADILTTKLLADARDGLTICREALASRLGMIHHVLDIGAHHGIFAIAALDSGADEAVCVEASRSNYGVMLENLLANDMLKRAHPLHAAAYESDQRTVALRKTFGNNSGQFSVEFDERYAVSDRDVPVIRFTTLFAMRLWDYVKIDVEGAEWSLLNRGADAIPEIMQNVRFLDIELHSLDNTDYYSPQGAVHRIDDVIEWFRKHGHKVGLSDAHPTRLFVVRG